MLSGSIYMLCVDVHSCGVGEDYLKLARERIAKVRAQRRGYQLDKMLDTVNPRRQAAARKAAKARWAKGASDG